MAVVSAQVRTVLLALCIGVAASIASALPSSSATRHVVMLFDERPELVGLAAMSDELERTLVAGSRDRFEFYREAMDLSRFGSKTYESVLRDALRAKYADKKIDVVVAFYPGALDFLLNHGSEIFPAFPSFFVGSTRESLATAQCPLMSTVSL